MAAVDRLAHVRRLLPDGCDALLVTTPTNIRYLSGFTGSNATVLVRRDEAWLITDRRYEERAADEVGGRPIEISMAPGDGIEAITEILGPDSCVGVEADNVSWTKAAKLQERFGPDRVRATSGLVEQIRAIKDDDELAAMQAAASIADRALASVLPLLERSASEREIAAAFEEQVSMCGGDGLAFDPIVASGPNASRPHHAVSARAVSKGDLVIIDCGAEVGGYRSDMTRSFVIGQPTAQQTELLEAVERAQAAGVTAVGPGVDTCEIDAACRKALGAEGLDAFFVHGTGHGVGLDIHEAPSVHATSTATLAPGHVITVEPGVYLPGVGGVRWEDTVVVTDSGANVLTKHPKRPIIGA